MTSDFKIDPNERGYSVLKEAEAMNHNHKSGHVYTSQEVYEIEKEKIFKKDWLCVGRVEEVENVGDYITHRIADEPIIATKNREGKIVAMANVCKHRGVQVAFGDGNTKNFTCPYHGWVYDLNGNLKSALHLEQETFEPKKCQLPHLKVDTWAGFIFVTFDQNAKPLLECLGNVDEIYDVYQFDKMRLAAKFPTELNCNWKLLNENLTDIYHIAVLHLDTFGKHQPLEGYRFETTPQGGYHGRFQGGALAPGGKSLFGPIPWLPEELHSGGYSSHIPPNMAFFPRYDNLSCSVNWPIDVDHCMGWTYIMFPEEFFEDPEFEEKVKIYEDFYKAFLDEDIEMIHSLQKGLKSDYYGRGPMSPFEAGVAGVIKHNIEDIGTSD